MLLARVQVKGSEHGREEQTVGHPRRVLPEHRVQSSAQSVKPSGWCGSTQRPIMASRRVELTHDLSGYKRQGGVSPSSSALWRWSAYSLGKSEALALDTVVGVIEGLAHVM